MPRKVQHTQRARNDLIDIWNYFDEVGAPAAGEKLLRKIARALGRLASLPESAQLRRELRPDLRSFPVGKYIIYFDYSETELRLVRVVHGARDITPDLFDE
ncbi:MAG TPA: type II toxin-antitoxin system RelE/ParE family toxin [Devosia sp.]